MKINPFKIERYYDKYEFKADYMLSSSDCESLSIQELLALEPGSAEKFQQQWLGYTESPGGIELREEIARLYRSIQPTSVLVHNGSEEPIFNFMNSMLDRGDHVIVHFPCYQSLMEVALAVGCEVTKWQTRPEDGWELDLDFLQKSIRPNTRAIVINSPHNPTGYLMSPAKLEGIVEIARQHNLLLFSDEMYRYLEYNGGQTLPAACELYENAVSLSGTAKAFGLPGLRIGWVATRNPAVYAAMAAFKDYLTICANAPGEFLSGVMLRQRTKIVERNLGIIGDNLALLDTFFSRHSDLFDWTPPRASSVAFPSLKSDLDSAKFCADLVEQKSVLLLPGNVFDFGNRHFRIGLGRKNLPTALALLEEFVSEYTF